MPTDSGIELVWCNACFSDTEHDLVHGEEIFVGQPGGGRSPAAVSVLRCRGCRNFCLRQEIAASAQGETAGGDQSPIPIFHPARLWHRPPGWLPELEEHAPELKALLVEIYSATNDQQFRLLAMGVRAALDDVMTHIVGDVGDFASKLARMVQTGHLSADREEMLRTVIDAGSAAAHRGFKPPRDLLQHMVTVMEDIIGGHYITGPMLRQLRQHIPPRPARRPPA